MHLSDDSYSTIAKETKEILFKDRKSKFYGFAFPIQEASEIKPIVESLKRQFPTANHFCYAWQLGIEHKTYRANDDGEPKNSAGMPIYGQIQSYELTNVLVVIVRVFGGVKLGVSGLINAYKTTTQMVLNSATIEKRSIETKLKLIYDYSKMNEVMRVIKRRNVRIVSQQMENKCSLYVAVPKSQTERVQKEFEKIRAIELTLL